MPTINQKLIDKAVHLLNRANNDTITAREIKQFLNEIVRLSPAPPKKKVDLLEKWNIKI